MRTTAMIAALAAAAGACGGARDTAGGAGARCAGRQPGDLVVTEMLVDPAGTDTGKEYVEIFNATGGDVDLGGLVLYAAAPDEKKVTLDAATVPAGAYFVLAGAHASDPVPAYVGLSFGSGLGSLRNAAGTIGLRCGDTQLDEVAYTTTRAGHARELDGALVPDFSVNDDAGRWCDAVEPIPGTDDFGTPGAPNSPCPPATSGAGGASGGDGAPCTDPATGTSRAPVAPSVGDLVITEIMAHPGVAPETSGEWLELYAVRDLDLNGLTVKTTSGAATLAAPDCLRVPAGAYALLARSDDPAANGGLPAVTAKLAVALADGTGTVAITNGDVLVDSASWASSTKGVAAQLDPAKISAAANDDPAAFCPATDFFAGAGGDKGTPGAPNTACLAPGSDEQTGGDGTCLDADGGQPRDVVHPAAGDLVITEVMADPAAAPDAAGEWFEVTAAATVDLNGLELANEGSGSSVVSAHACLALAPGDRAVFARSDDPAANGGLPPVAARFGFALANTGTAAAPRAVVLRSGGLEIDRMTYTASKPGVSWQLAPDRTGAAANDDTTAWCFATAAAFGAGDHGTPGATNGPCP